MTNIERYLTVDTGNPPDVQMCRGAYMFLATQNGVSILESNCKIQRSCGADVRLFTAEEIQEKFVWLNVEGVAAASTCLDGNEG